MAKEVKTEPVKTHVDPMRDMVTVNLPRATGSEDSHLFVALNGKGYRIQKGVPVRLPRPVAEIIWERERQIDRQAAFLESLQLQLQTQRQQVPGAV